MLNIISCILSHLKNGTTIDKLFICVEILHVFLIVMGCKDICKVAFLNCVEMYVYSNLFTVLRGTYYGSKIRFNLSNRLLIRDIHIFDLFWQCVSFFERRD